MRTNECCGKCKGRLLSSGVTYTAWLCENSACECHIELCHTTAEVENKILEMVKAHAKEMYEIGIQQGLAMALLALPKEVSERGDPKDHIGYAQAKAHNYCVSQSRTNIEALITKE